jgi:hypothetical protein
LGLVVQRELLVGQPLLELSPLQVVSVIQVIPGPLALLEQGVTSTLLVELAGVVTLLVVVVVVLLQGPGMVVMAPPEPVQIMALAVELGGITLLALHPVLRQQRSAGQRTA